MNNFSPRVFLIVTWIEGNSWYSSKYSTVQCSYFIVVRKSCLFRCKIMVWNSLCQLRGYLAIYLSLLRTRALCTMRAVYEYCRKDKQRWSETHSDDSSVIGGAELLYLLSSQPSYLVTLLFHTCFLQGPCTFSFTVHSRVQPTCTGCTVWTGT